MYAYLQTGIKTIKKVKQKGSLSYHVHIKRADTLVWNFVRWYVQKYFA